MTRYLPLKLAAILFLALLLSDLAEAKPQTEAKRTFNVSTNPYGLLSGSYEAGLEARLSKAVTAGPYAHYSHTADDDGYSQSVGFGVRADYSFSGEAFTDSWYLSPFVSRYDFRVKVRDVDDEIYSTGALDFRAVNLGFTTGYGWFSPSGFNLRVGLGAMYTTLSGDYELERRDGTHDTPDETAHIAGWLPTGDLIFGYMF